MQLLIGFRTRLGLVRSRSTLVGVAHLASGVAEQRWHVQAGRALGSIAAHTRADIVIAVIWDEEDQWPGCPLARNAALGH